MTFSPAALRFPLMTGTGLALILILAAPAAARADNVADDAGVASVEAGEAPVITVSATRTPRPGPRNSVDR
jgi:hypothetical protein